MIGRESPFLRGASPDKAPISQVNLDKTDSPNEGVDQEETAPNLGAAIGQYMRAARQKAQRNNESRLNRPGWHVERPYRLYGCYWDSGDFFTPLTMSANQRAWQVRIPHVRMVGKRR